MGTILGLLWRVIDAKTGDLLKNFNATVDVWVQTDGCIYVEEMDKLIMVDYYQSNAYTQNVSFIIRYANPETLELYNNSDNSIMPTSDDYCAGGWGDNTYDAQNKIIYTGVYKMVDENVTCAEYYDPYDKPRRGYIIAMNATNGRVESTSGIVCNDLDCPLSIQYWAGI